MHGDFESNQVQWDEFEELSTTMSRMNLTENESGEYNEQLKKNLLKITALEKELGILKVAIIEHQENEAELKGIIEELSKKADMNDQQYKFNLTTILLKIWRNP